MNNNLVNRYNCNQRNNGNLNRFRQYTRNGNERFSQNNRMYEYRMRIKEEQQRRYMAQIKKEEEQKNYQRREFDRMDRKELSKIVINGNTTQKNNNISNFEINRAFEKAQSEQDQILKNHWNKRTNKPYKNIISDDRYIKKFVENPNRKIGEDELIVHSVTEKDKNIDMLRKDYRELTDGIKKHNKELQNMFSKDNELEHKQKFNYNNVSKYRAANCNKKDETHNQLKTNTKRHYERARKDLEIGEKDKNNIIESLNNISTIVEEHKSIDKNILKNYEKRQVYISKK